MQKKVISAYYGGVDGNSVFKAKDVTTHLQELLDKGVTKVTPNPGPFADPYFGTHKGFYAELDWGDGSRVVFLCTDNGQTIDFSQKPVPQAPAPKVAATGNIVVNKAWYGTSLTGTNVQKQQDVTGALQQMINDGAKAVQITSLPDPAFGHHKGLFALITNNGVPGIYMDGGYTTGQIDFTQSPVMPPGGKAALQVNSLELKYHGKPTPKQNYVFSLCKFNILNGGLGAFPPSPTESRWVSVDFYASSTNTATSLSSMTKIGDVPASFHADAKGQLSFKLTDYELHGITRDALIPGRLNSGLYYVYVQVRNDHNAMTGVFSAEKYQLPPK